MAFIKSVFADRKCVIQTPKRGFPFSNRMPCDTMRTWILTAGRAERRNMGYSIYSGFRLLGVGGLLVGSMAAGNGIRQGIPLTYAEYWIPCAFVWLICIAFLMIVLRYERRKRRLQAEGIKVSGKVIEVEQSRLLRVNGRCVYVVHIECVHPQSGRGMKVRTESLISYPMVRKGDEAEVWLDPADENVWYVSVEDLFRSDRIWG